MYLIPHHFSMNPSTTGDSFPLTHANLKTMGAIVQAKSTNTGRVVLGSNQASASSYGISLAAGDSVSISGQIFGWANAEINLKDFHLFASTSGDAVSVLYFARKDDDD